MQKGQLHVLPGGSGSGSSGLCLAGKSLAQTRWSLKFLQRLNPRIRGACVIGCVELDLSSRSILRLTILLTSWKVGWYVVMRQRLSLLPVWLLGLGAKRASLSCRKARSKDS